MTKKDFINECRKLNLEPIQVNQHFRIIIPETGAVLATVNLFKKNNYSFEPDKNNENDNRLSKLNAIIQKLANTPICEREL